MADFSPSGLEGMGFPSLTLEALQQGGDPDVLGWIREAVIEGDRIIRADANYEYMEAGMAYVSGDRPVWGKTQPLPQYIPNVRFNDSRRVVQAHTSALTDLKPLFAYKALDHTFDAQAHLLNQLTIAWWITQRVDLELGYAVKYALATGTADMTIEWDPYCAYGGDIRLSARDARDTLPIRPATHARGIQAWSGVILREAHTVNALRALYPTAAHLFRPTTDSLMSTLMGGIRRLAARLVSPAADTLAGLNAPAVASRTRSGDVLLYRVYLDDHTKNLTTRPIPMGTPTAGWSYVVPPGGYLYPYKRLIVATPEAVLYDGPSPYWHGQYPLARLKLWDLPWNFLGQPLLKDLLGVQDAIDQLAQDLLLGLRKWLDPSVAYNRGAVSENFMRTYDPRKPASRVMLNQAGIDAGFKHLEGPPPPLLSMALQGIQYLSEKFDTLSDTPNLQALLALRQLPGADTVREYFQALTPGIRQEGRMLEGFMTDVAEQCKVLRFQFESNARRVAILGQAGELLEDFDYDPGNLVPALGPADAGYKPALDARLPRDQRAQAFHKSIVFTMAPNSLLAINATERKMIALQNFRMGVIDFWTYHEVMETPNVGAPPAIPLPMVPPPTPEEQVAALSQPDGLVLLAQQGISIDPMTGQWLQIRTPVTITERLLAQNQLGIGTAASPASGEGPPQGNSGAGGGPGRPASGQAPPQLEQKSDGRTTVTESRHTPGPNSDR